MTDRALLQTLETTGSAGQVPIRQAASPGLAWGASPGGPPSGPAGGDLAGTYPNPTGAATLERTANKDAVSGYAGLNAASRTTKGIDGTDDLIVDLATKGLVIKDTQGTPHYWRVSISVLGVLITTDLGTVKP